MSAVLSHNTTQAKLDQILHPQHALCKEDVVWVLELIKKNVAEQDPGLMDLPPPRLLKNFQCFAEIAMLLIHRRPGNDQEADRLKAWMREAAYGLYPKAGQPNDRP